MLRDIVERETKAPQPPTAPSIPGPSPSGSGFSSSSGFPAIVHRSQRTTKRSSAFANRNAQSGPHIGKVVDTVPTVGRSGPGGAASGSRPAPAIASGSATPSADGVQAAGRDLSALPEAERIRREVDAENAARVQGMSAEERAQEADELKERFGPGIVEMMRRRREARLATTGSGADAGAAVHLGLAADAKLAGGCGGLTEAQRVYQQVDSENQAHVESMSYAEREQELKELEERFGKGIMEKLRQRALARASGTGDVTAGAEDHAQSSNAAEVSNDPPRTIDSTAARSSKSVRFDSTTKPLSDDALPASQDLQGATSRTGTGTGTGGGDDLSRYFPGQQPEHSKLAWTQPLTNSVPSAPSAGHRPSSPTAPPSTSTLRFDLSGQLLSAAQQADIPVSHGLHHHGLQPDLAGYTLDEMLLLARSTVVMQRVSMMGLLTRVIDVHVFDLSHDLGFDLDRDEGRNAGEVEESNGAARLHEVLAELARLKVLDKAVAIAIDIIFSRRNVSLLSAAISLLYTSLGGPGWTYLDPTPTLSSRTTPFRPTSEQYGPLALPDMSSVPFEDLLPVLSDLLGDRTFLEPASSQQLIPILRRAATHSEDMARTVLALGPKVLRAHTTSLPWPVHTKQEATQTNHDGVMPLSAPIALVTDLVSASRECAVELHNARIADGLLRFLVCKTWPTVSAPTDGGIDIAPGQVDNDTLSEDEASVIALAQRAEAAELATETLRLLAAFGRYGLGAALATGAMDIWRDLYADIARHLSGHVSLVSGPAETEYSEVERECMTPVIVAYFDLLAVWTTCAIDPHRTTPEHDLTWSQMDNFGWVDQAVEVVGLVMKSIAARPNGPNAGVERTGAAVEAEADGNELSTLSAALGALVAWLDGIKVNGVKQGEAEKASVAEKLLAIAPDAVRRVVEFVLRPTTEIQQDVLLRLVQVHTRLLNDPSPRSSAQILSTSDIAALRQRYISPIPRGPLASVYSASAIAFELTRLPSVHPLEETSQTTDTLSHLLTALPLLQTFQQGAEPLALDVLDSVLHVDTSKLPVDLRETILVDKIGHQDGLLILRPLLQHAILADDRHVTGPTKVESAYLKATTSLRASSREDGAGKTPLRSSGDDEEGDRKSSSRGLPLTPDWLLHPIGELLRSADSVALQQAPADWSATETELVRAALSLVVQSIEISSATTGPASATRRSERQAGVEEDEEGFVKTSPKPTETDIVLKNATGPSGEGSIREEGGVRGMSRSQILFGIMRVYMLEHQPVAGPTDGEVFRDDVVSALIGRLMGYLSTVPPAEIHASALAASSTPQAVPVPVSRPVPPLEAAAAPYLSPEPFFTFYQDLLHLFENASFGDALFARIILAPLAFGLGYDTEYRKLFWSSPNVLRLIRTSVADAPIEDESPDKDVRVYWSLEDEQTGRVRMESDPEVLAAYGQALVKGWIRSELLEQIALRGLIAFFYTGSAPSSSAQHGEAEKAMQGESEKDRREALEKLRKGLMSAVFSGAPDAVVQKLLGSDGAHNAAAGQSVPGNVREERKKVVVELCGGKVSERLK